VLTDPRRSGTFPLGLPRSSKCVLGRERRTMRSRFVASPAAWHRDSVSHRDPPRIAALVASRFTSTQVSALRCDRRDSGLASRHFFSGLDRFASVAQRIAGLRRFALGGTRGRSQTAPLGLGLLCLTDPEFCWRGPLGDKPWATRTTYHTRRTGAEASPVERCSPGCAFRNSTHAGDPRSSNSLLDGHSIRL